MAVLKNLCVAVTMLAGLLTGLVAQACTPADQVCPNVVIAPRDSFPDILGTWYLYASSPAHVYTTKHCGLFKSSSPCSCLGLDYTIPSGTFNYTTLSVISFAQNKDTKIFHEKADDYLAMALPVCDNAAVYNVESVDGKSPLFKFARLGTDGGQTYVVYFICSAEKSNNSPIVWFFSRTPVATDNAISAVKGILAKSNISYDILKQVDQTNCPYTKSHL